MDSDDIVERLNAHPPAVIRTLGGRVLGYAPERHELRMQFHIGLEFCHTVDIVQGGFITAMLDASMAHAVLAAEHGKVRVSSIDIQVSFLRPARAGGFTAVGSIVKSGRTIAFLKAELYAHKGELVATATSSAHLTREHK
ncbi:MAG TPA: PaaI family thioesterase [Rubrivivax sp.]|nr:PaaI family thioesterase [Rubrivivax sp.]